HFPRGVLVDAGSVRRSRGQRQTAACDTQWHCGRVLYCGGGAAPRHATPHHGRRGRAGLVMFGACCGLAVGLLPGAGRLATVHRNVPVGRGWAAWRYYDPAASKGVSPAKSWASLKDTPAFCRTGSREAPRRHHRAPPGTTVPSAAPIGLNATARGLLSSECTRDARR
ncbi:Hypothetical predicted protein, partial [Olea europaea subsp. europaea]